MTTDELKAEFKTQFNDVIDRYHRYHEPDTKCAYAAGMLLILSALKAKDGTSIPMQIAVMHAALREVGEERGWSLAAG